MLVVLLNNRHENRRIQKEHFCRIMLSGSLLLCSSQYPNLRGFEKVFVIFAPVECKKNYLKIVWISTNQKKLEFSRIWLSTTSPLRREYHAQINCSERSGASVRCAGTL